MNDEQSDDLPTGLEDFPEPSGAPVRRPHLPPEYAHADADAVGRVLDEQARQLAQPAGNLDVKGAPHFLRNIGGEEVCGQDGQPWPCDAWRQIGHQSARLEGLSPASQLLPTMTEAAAAAGMDLGEFEERLRQTRGQ
jgi:hypothetical protein